MAETGTESRKEAIGVIQSRRAAADRFTLAARRGKGTADLGTKAEASVAFVPRPFVSGGEHAGLVQNRVQRLRRAAQRQVADVEMPDAEIEQRPDRAGADLDRRRTGRRTPRSTLPPAPAETAAASPASPDWRCDSRTRRTRQARRAPRRSRFVEKRLDLPAPGDATQSASNRNRRWHVPSSRKSTCSERRAVGFAQPPSSRSAMARPDVLTQLPGMRDAAWTSDVLVAAEHDERLKLVMRDLIGVAETELAASASSVRNGTTCARATFGAEVGDEVAQVVFFLRADGAVGDHHPHVLPRERSDRVIGVDPGVDALARLQLRPRRPQLDRHDWRRRRPQQVQIGRQLMISDLVSAIIRDFATSRFRTSHHAINRQSRNRSNRNRKSQIVMLTCGIQLIARGRREQIVRECAGLHVVDAASATRCCRSGQACHS